MTQQGFQFVLDGSVFAEHQGAIFSDDPDRRYRFALWRSWDVGKHFAMFVLLNPSTADHETDDPTITRLTYRAKQAGHGGLVVCNAFGFRATKPIELKRASRAGVDVVGMPKNDDVMMKWAKHAQAVIVGWGTHCEEVAPGRGAFLLDLLRGAGCAVFALGFNADGSPYHPLFRPYDELPKEWSK